MLDLSRVVFTNHALVQFKKRHNRLNLNNQLKRAGLKKVELTTRKLLYLAEEDIGIDPIGRVRRLIDNHCKPALYYIHDGWRFVLIEEGDKQVVVTIERDRNL